MTVSRVTTWSAGNTLTADALNGEFDNVVDGVNDALTPTATGSTTARTLAARFADWYNVMDYGAAGDGTTNDAAAIAAAIAAVPSSGGVVYFPTPSVSYAVGAAGFALSSKTNLTLLGMGAKLKITAVSSTTLATAGATTIRLSSCTNCTVDGFIIDGNSVATNLIGLYQCTDCTVSGNRLSSGGLNAGIFSWGGTRNRITRNSVASLSGTARGIWSGNVNTAENEIDSIVQGNYVHDIGASGIVVSGTGFVVNDNICDNNAGSGITLSSAVASGVTCQRGVVANNISKNNTFHGIQADASVAGTDVISDVSVTGNLCELNDASGIYAVNVEQWTIQGNTCRNNNADASGTGAGIQLEQARRCTVQGNTCYDSRSGGSRTQDPGIYVIAQTSDAEVEDVTINGNLVYNHPTDGILLATSGDGTIETAQVTNNVSTDNGTRNIYLNGSTSILTSLVSGNTTVGAATHDIRLDSSDVTIGENRYDTQSNVSFTTSYPLPVNDTTPSVKGRRHWREENTGATTISMFDDGRAGQEIVILFTSSNTTITDGGNIKLSAAFTSTANDVMKLIFDGTDWYETSRSVN